jgi:hypothetical protein
MGVRGGPEEEGAVGLAALHEALVHLLSLCVPATIWKDGVRGQSRVLGTRGKMKERQ